MVSAGIIGGGGYTAGELIRILIHHPQARIAWVVSESQAGQPVDAIHTDLIGETQLRFAAMPESEAEVVFLCSGHGQSKAILEKYRFPAQTVVIDLSNDFRLAAPGNPFVYGLPELHREQLRTATRIANPGCFATAIQLGLLPLAQAGLLNGEVHVQAITGATGAGQKPEATTHFSWRSNNLSVYKAFSHQHLPEIVQGIRLLQPAFVHDLNFVPIRGDFARGIFASMYINCAEEEGEIHSWADHYYQTHPFTVRSETNPNLKQVVNTNKCVVYYEKIGKKLLIISIIDNLTKGASGQAVQNMNLALGLNETEGLWLKSLAF